MPALLTHHLFGCDVHHELARLIGQSDAAREAFLLGNIGPDPLFCLKILPASTSYRDIGTLMHSQPPRPLFAAMHEHFIAAPEEARSDELRAFALGFLCHYLLDSSVHPLVYAQQHALTAAGIEGIDRPARDVGRIVHAQIETALDEYTLTTKLGITVAQFTPHREALRCEAGSLAALSEKQAHVVKEAFGIVMPADAFARAVKMYRAAQHVLDSKRNGIRKRLDYARLTGASYLNIRALTHDERIVGDTPFSNSDHIPWPHPFEPDRTMDASFEELYDAAFVKALDVLPKFAETELSNSELRRLIGNRNFHGRSAEVLD